MLKNYFLYLSLLVFGLSSCRSLSEDQLVELDRGNEIYIANCISCHGDNGDGMGGAYPSLINDKITEANTKRAIYIIKNGSAYAEGMKPVPISDKEIAEVVNFIQNSWGNEAAFITEKNIN